MPEFWIGERGPELVVLPEGGRVISVEDIRRLLDRLKGDDDGEGVATSS